MRAIFAASLTLLLAGCSISDSVKSSFESSASSSGSSSASSGSRRDSYVNDVSQYTEAYAKSGGQFDAFTRGLTSIAQKHGVNDWESDPDTFKGIGAGLKQAAVAPAQFEVWKQNLSKDNATNAAAMQQGYNAAKSK